MNPRKLLTTLLLAAVSLLTAPLCCHGGGAKLVLDDDDAIKTNFWTATNANAVIAGINNATSSQIAWARVLPTGNIAALANNSTATLTLGNVTLSLAAVSGNGSGLTALNASAISSGTLADARLGSNVIVQSGATSYGKGLLTTASAAALRGAASGVQIASPNGGRSGIGDLITGTPDFQGQPMVAFWGNIAPYIGIAGSTTQGDAFHAASFPGGISNIGDPDHMDANAGDVTLHLNGAPSRWDTAGDGLVTAMNWSGNAFSSGSGFNNAIMSVCNAVSAATVAHGGSGYAVNDQLTVAGGTVVTGEATTPCYLIVKAVNGSGAITSIGIANAGRYSANPAATNSPTGGSGSGASISLTFGVAAYNVLPRNGSAFMHIPSNRDAGLIPGWSELVFNRHEAHHKGLAVCGPGLPGSLFPGDSGNFSLGQFDFYRGCFSVPQWVAGVYQPSQSGWRDAFRVYCATGAVRIGDDVSDDVVRRVIEGIDHLGIRAGTENTHSIFLRRAPNGYSVNEHHSYGGTASLGRGHTFWSGGVLADQALKFMISNDLNVTYVPLVFGGLTNSYPMLKRNGAALDARLADDSGDAKVSVAALKMASNASAANRELRSSGTNGVGLIWRDGAGTDHPIPQRFTWSPSFGPRRAATLQKIIAGFADGEGAQISMSWTNPGIGSGSANFECDANSDGVTSGYISYTNAESLKDAINANFGSALVATEGGGTITVSTVVKASGATLAIDSDSDTGATATAAQTLAAPAYGSYRIRNIWAARANGPATGDSVIVSYSTAALDVATVVASALGDNIKGVGSDAVQVTVDQMTDFTSGAAGALRASLVDGTLEDGAVILTVVGTIE